MNNYAHRRIPSGDPPPQPWRLCRHPNNDIYFYHPEFRLLTPDDVRESDILHYIMEARCDILRCLARDENLGVLPIDYELVIYNVSESAAEIQMYSRSAGTAYKWEENGGIKLSDSRVISNSYGQDSP